jgi:GAF domain-containing protein
MERKVIVLSDLPAEYIRISSGLGEAPPRFLAAVPITMQNRVLAVVEIASFTALTDQQRALLDEAAGMVALKLEVLQRNLRTRELLEQTQTQAQELAAQSEALHEAKAKAEVATEMRSMFLKMVTKSAHDERHHRSVAPRSKLSHPKQRLRFKVHRAGVAAGDHQ